MKKFLMAVLAVIMSVSLFLAWGCADKHNFSDTYSFDDVYHWQQCLDDGCNETKNKGEHSFQLIGTKNTCTVCGYNYDTANTYEVNLQTIGGTVIAGATINLYDSSNALVATAKTNIRGRALFSDLEITSYVAKIDVDTLPKGYYVPIETQEIELTRDNMKATVKLPSALIDEQMPANHKYKVGSVAYDFRTTAVDEEGNEKYVSLSAYLSQYNAVVLNFWYAGCAPCRTEFPYMNEAYNILALQRDKIAVLAVNSGADTSEEVADFVASTGYDFDFANDTDFFDAYNTAFSVKAYPTTVIIDRYGAVAYIDSGSIPSTSAWSNLFNHYIASDYVPDYVGDYNGGSEDGTGSTLTKPDVDMPSSEQIAEVITAVNTNTNKDTFTFLPEDNEYSWPWIIGEKNGFDCIKTSNKDRVSSYSILLIDVQLKKGQQVFFDYFISTEADSDILYIQVDTVLQAKLSGEDSEWHNDQLLYVASRDGKYQISLTYQKDVMNSIADDTVYIKNLRIEEGADINGHFDLLYNATDNYTLDENAVIPEKYTGYINHVAYYYNETDGFYHVALSGDANQKDLANDPILYADLYYSTPWNSNSVWMLAYAEAGLFGASDPDYKEGYAKAIEDYAWIQQNNQSNYAPLTKELQQILADMVIDLGRTDHENDPHGGVDQWLEICRYYIHYGSSETEEVCVALDNTVEALKWRVAKDYGTMTENELLIHVDVYSVHLPRGNYYRFKTTKAGAYIIRSLEEPASDYNEESQDTLGFVCDEKGNILAENDNFIIEAQGTELDANGNLRDTYDNNFYIFVYLEADTTYFVAGCFNDPYAMGEYDVLVEYKGATYTYFTPCATDPAYTYDEDDPNFTPFILPIMGKDRFFIGDDGNYYAQEYDGSQGSPIYIRLIGPTYLNSYTNYTLEQLIESGSVGTTQEEKLYLAHKLVEARTTYEESDTLYGYVVATEKLVSIINKFANGSDTEESGLYSQTSWLLCAYYYRNITPLTLLQAQAKFEK